jgi:RimJ/RimL family protein N-acetyltransferase
MPFRLPWTDRIGTPEYLPSFLEFHRGLRRDWQPESWTLELGVWADGELIGTQALRGERFALLRTVDTGSWLAQRFQGRGYGTEMRVAVLTLAFVRLGACAATSGAFEDNPASKRVSEKLGYQAVGEQFFTPRGERVRELVFRLERDEWERRGHLPVEIVGLEPCLPLFGLEAVS